MPPVIRPEDTGRRSILPIRRIPARGLPVEHTRNTSIVHDEEVVEDLVAVSELECMASECLQCLHVLHQLLVPNTAFLIHVRTNEDLVESVLVFAGPNPVMGYSYTAECGSQCEQMRIGCSTSLSMSFSGIFHCRIVSR